jgi:hypothetical protein
MRDIVIFKGDGGLIKGDKGVKIGLLEQRKGGVYLL